MIKSLMLANKSERERFTIPRSVQETIPVKCVYPDGIWLVGSKHSKSWRLTDVNYAAASDEERRGIFLAYGGVLNSLPTDAATKITIINRRLNPVDFERSILMEERWDGLDEYRQAANAILKRRAAESNNLVQEKYITLSIPQRKIEETRSYFRRVDGNLTKSLGRLDSTAREVASHDRLRILHDFFRPGEEQYLPLTRQRRSDTASTSKTWFARTVSPSKPDILRWAVSTGASCSSKTMLPTSRTI